MFSKSRVIVEARITRMDGTTGVAYGTEELGSFRTLLARIRLWCLARMRRDPR